MSSTEVPPPKSTASERLALTAFRTRSSHTPSQFQSPGRRFLPRAELSGSLEVVALAADSEVGELGEDISRWDCRTEARWDLHAWYAPGFAAASSVTESRTDSSLKVERMYSSTRTMVVSWTGVAAALVFSVARRPLSGVSPCAGVPVPDPLTVREFAGDLRERPNQCGNPWRRLKPPGGNRSSSVALTVSVSEEPVVYVYVVNGVSSGWKTSVAKVTRGGSVG